MFGVLWDALVSCFEKPVAIKPKIIAPVSTIPQCGIDLIEKFEGCKLGAYRDQAGILTIGYGHTSGVKEGDTCTQAQAEAWLAEDVASTWEAIQKLVKVPLSPEQGGALLSLVYNIGQGLFARSSLLQMLNSGNYCGVPDKIKQFIWITLPDGGRRINTGLSNRRKAEALLWCNNDWRQV